MAIAFGAQAVNASPGISSTTHAATVTLSAGDLAILCISNRDVSTGASSVVGSVNGAYTRAGASGNWVAQDIFAEIWYFQNCAAGSETVTATMTSSRAGINLSRWTGAKTTAALDQDNTNQTTAPATIHFGSITATGAGVIITALQGLGDSVTGAAQTGFVALTNNDLEGFNRSYYGYRIIATGETNDGDMSLTTPISAVGKIASFLEPAGGPPITDGPKLLAVRSNIRLN